MLILLSLLSPTAEACGQSTHIWTAMHALDHLPEGDLADLLRRDEVQQMLVNGTMFPDGGYSPLSPHPFGEASHWEPFQTAYLDHVRGTYDDLTTPEAAEHVAFLMGLAAHGIGDQYFDVAYLRRSKVIDNWSSSNVDFTSDIVMMADYGPVPVVPSWYPDELFVELFDAQGIEVDVRTMNLGLASLHLAVGVVQNGAEDAASVEDLRQQIPWAHEHLGDASVPGSPACVGELIVAYWQVLWGRLDGTYDFEATPVMGSWPEEGAGHVQLGRGIEGAMHIIVSRALSASSVTDQISLEGPEGPIEVDVDLGYGENSHVFVVSTPKKLKVEGKYTLRLAAGLESFDGETAGDWESHFWVGDAPVVGGPHTEGCGCGHGPAGGGLLWGWMTVWMWRRRR